MTSIRRQFSNDEALAAFVARKAEIDAMLERLAALSDEHFSVGPDDVSWGDVGNLGFVAERLRQACDFIFKEGECAS
ncbi:MAG: hypothetical protein WAS73_06910 [Defluviicoccus sp.]